jgi:hypothetical protein
MSLPVAAIYQAEGLKNALEFVGVVFASFSTLIGLIFGAVTFINAGRD